MHNLRGRVAFDLDRFNTELGEAHSRQKFADSLQDFEPKPVTVTVDDSEIAAAVRMMMEIAGHKFLGGSSDPGGTSHTMHFLK
jgi:hypothetical protein